jgi:hypothetical protein
MRLGRRRKLRLTKAWTTTMTNWSIQDSRVARAAPSTPMAGNPNLPKINTQLRKVLVNMGAVRT